MAAFASYEFSIDNHQMKVIEVDGVDTQVSDFINTFRINVAQRYSVLVTADQSNGNFWIRAHSMFMNPWTSMPKAQFPTGFNPNALATITYSNTLPNIPTSQPWSTIIRLNDIKLIPYNSQTINYLPDISFLVQFSIYNTPQDPVVKAYLSINNSTYKSYQIPNIPTLFEIARGTPLSNLSANLNAVSVPANKLIEITIINADPGEHPFHLHGHAPFIVSKGNINTPYDKIPVKVVNPLRRDTFTVPACNIDASNSCIDVGYTTIRFISDNPGVWLLHCHIEWHIQSGLSMTIVENPDAIKKKGLVGFSKDFINTCNLQ
jgi:iron transport multicopper oxidase